MKDINETTQVNKDTQATITLGQLKAMIRPTAGKHLPTAKQLRENDERFMTQPLYDGCIDVYHSGFAVYRSGRHTTVLRIDRISSHTYEFSTADRMVSLDDQPWATALTLAAEKRIEAFQNDRLSRRCVGFMDDYDDEASEDRELSDAKVLAGTDNVEETVADRLDDRMKKLLACLTERQRQVVTMYYINDMKQKEIADALGITKPAVCIALQSAVNRLKNKSIELFETT